MISIRHLDWDSDFFGIRIARLEGARLEPEDVPALEAQVRAERIDCLYFLADAGEPATVALAEAAGFRPVDVRVTLELAPVPGSPPIVDSRVRAANAADLPALEDIAAEAHRDTRFFSDPHFPRDRAVELYRTWIRNSVQGWSDTVLVVDEGGGPVGYASAHLRGAGPGEIGLVGVAARAQGQGHGQALVGAVVRWLQEQGCARVRVVTQGGNAAALRLYQGAGFRVVRSETWYHRWTSGAPPSRSRAPLT